MSKRKLLVVLALGAMLALAVVGVTYAQGPRGNNPPCGGWFGTTDCPYSNGGWGGMMGGWNAAPNQGYGPSMMGGRGHGMMGGSAYNNPWTAPNTSAVETLDQAVEVAEAFIASWGADNLALSEVMQFDNHFYAEAVETDTGRGAFEFLIDPASGAVTPEHGPNMMWNLRYGMHTGTTWGTAAANDGVEMTVSAEDAQAAAQAYLDQNFNGLSVGDEAEAFYGYYTLHVMNDGAIVGMLSVNGYTGDVWPHTWHGTFIDMVHGEGDHDA